jgi:hypothetical protein
VGTEGNLVVLDAKWEGAVFGIKREIIRGVEKVTKLGISIYVQFT